MAKSEFEKDLKKMGKVFNAAKKVVREGEWPEGDYEFQLQSYTLKHSKAGNLMAVSEHLCTAGEKKGQVLHERQMLHTDIGMRFFLERVEKLGYEMPDKPEDTEDTVDTIHNDAPHYTAKVVCKDGFTNLYVQQITDGEPEDDDQEAPDEDEETPDEENGDDGDANEEGEEEDADLTELQAFHDSYGLDYDDDDGVEELVEGLKGVDWNADEQTAEEIELLKKHGIEVCKPKKKKKAKKKPAKKPVKKAKGKKKGRKKR